MTNGDYLMPYLIYRDETSIADKATQSQQGETKFNAKLFAVERMITKDDASHRYDTKC